MGKSNKFDYTNRPNSGAKLGQIIANALEKEADKVIRDADKQAVKNRKESVGSTASGVDAKDTAIHPLDIKVPSKQMGDEGACHMAVGLENALKKGRNQGSLALVDLNLSDNGLTTASLERLAAIITLAKHDLKTLDLSKNDIEVATTEQAVQWERFLLAFKDCRKLRRLDLGTNVRLGSRGLEILARLYSRDDPIQETSGGGETCDHLTEQKHGDKDAMDAPDAQQSAQEPDSDDATATAGHIKRPCGLSAVPYLILTNIGLSDAGALWLSYLLEYHRYPDQSTNGLSAGLPDSQAKQHQQDGASRGINWDEKEPGLGKDALHILRKAESIRRQKMIDDLNAITESTFLDGETSEGYTVDESGSRRQGSNGRSSDRISSGSHRHYRAPPGDRRGSLKSSQTVEEDRDISELESTRKKVQRTIIFQSGASSVELWRCALKVVASARVMTIIGPTSCGRGNAGQLSLDPVQPPSNHKKEYSLYGSNLAQKHTAPSGGKQAVSRREDSKTRSRRSGSYAAELAANANAVPGEPEACLTEVTNSPPTPKAMFKPHRKGAFSEGGDMNVDDHQLSLITQKLDDLAPRADPRRFLSWQESRMQHTPYRDLTVPNHLPPNVAEMVVRHVLTKREQDIMAPEQWARALAWGADRINFFRREQEWQRMAESAQVLMLLECIGCTAYGGKSAK